MTDLDSPQFSREVAEIAQRLFRLRNRFRVGIPENLFVLRKRIRESQLKGKFSDIVDFDTFYRVGIIFSHYSQPITMGEVSRDLEIPLSTATRMMDWFVQNGFVERLRDAEDRRVVRVGLTQSGQEIYHTINQIFMESVTRFMSHLTSEEQQTFFKLLTKVLDAFEKETQG